MYRKRLKLLLIDVINQEPDSYRKLAAEIRLHPKSKVNNQLCASVLIKGIENGDEECYFMLKEWFPEKIFPVDSASRRDILTDIDSIHDLEKKKMLEKYLK